MLMMGSAADVGGGDRHKEGWRAMGLFNRGKKQTYLTVVTQEAPGRLRINGLHVRDAKTKQSVVGHERTVCWVEFAADGTPLDRGLGRAAGPSGQFDRLLRDLPSNPTCRGVLDRLREGQDSVGKWLQLSDRAISPSS
jgi:hypothetical protein